jgi:AraC-like DNA-binding protein
MGAIVVEDTERPARQIELRPLTSLWFTDVRIRSVRHRRIERARKLLNDPEVTVVEAAVRSGFFDQSYFTKIFRRIVGVTPTGLYGHHPN